MAKTNVPSYFTLTAEQLAGFASFLSQGDGFYPVRAQEMQTVMPSGIQPKLDSGMAIVSGSTTANGVCVIMAYRIDEKAGMMDQQPLAISVSASLAGNAGMMVNHMSFVSRSVVLPSAFSGPFLQSGISNYYYNNPPYSVSSGSLTELPAPVKDALGVIVNLVKPFSSGSTA